MVGRSEEIYELEKLYESKKPELVAIYGRRRVGKTYLVSETFSDRITFHHAGLSPAVDNSVGILKRQLSHFYNSLLLSGMEESRTPASWMEAFLLLEKYLQSIDDGRKQLIFFDELPWLDTPKSGFMQAFEGFWNTWACYRKNIMVIVCGSAISWMQDVLINNHGGLYNRVTYEINLKPFNLSECEQFLMDNNINYSRYDIVQSYMVFGGIPFYLGYMDSRYSLAQNINRLFFSEKGRLKHEFDRLFDSIFVNPEVSKSIVRFLYTKNAGYTRKEIVDSNILTNGGRLTSHLNSLIACNFIIKYVPFGLGKRQECYKLVDPFCLFYLHFIEGQTKLNEKQWEQSIGTPPINTWRGLAFENVCFNHIEQIKKALGISGVISSTSPWSKRSDDETGAQIDLLIERNDNVINMCEMKFYRDAFVVNKDYYRTLLRRQDMILERVSPRIAVHSTLITTFGLKKNEYSNAFNNVITLDDLFS